MLNLQSNYQNSRSQWVVRHRQRHHHYKVSKTKKVNPGKSIFESLILSLRSALSFLLNKCQFARVRKGNSVFDNSAYRRHWRGESLILLFPILKVSKSNQRELTVSTDEERARFEEFTLPNPWKWKWKSLILPLRSALLFNRLSASLRGFAKANQCDSNHCCSVGTDEEKQISLCRTLEVQSDYFVKVKSLRTWFV